MEKPQTNPFASDFRNNDHAGAGSHTSSHSPPAQVRNNDTGELHINGHVIPAYENISTTNDEPPPSYEEAVNSPNPPLEHNIRPHHTAPPNTRYTYPRPSAPPPIRRQHSPHTQTQQQHQQPFGQASDRDHGFRLPGSYYRPDSVYQQRQARHERRQELRQARQERRQARQERREVHQGQRQAYQEQRGAPQPLPINPVTPRTPWVYPLGFYCYKCQNTGIKLKNSLQCKDCWDLFGPSSTHIRPITSVPSRHGGLAYYAPGDPALGGILCGRCRGSGKIDLLLFEDNCPVCRGIGRVNFQ